MSATAPTSAAVPAVLSPRHKRAVLAIILVSYFMIILDNSVIFTGLPSLQAELGLSAAELAWVQDAYTVVFGGLLLLGSRAGDILGRRRVFVFGLVVFTAASLLIAVAPTGWFLIASRALQGVGAAVVAPSALSLLTASFEGRERARAVAWYAATAGIGGSLGMVVGGAAVAWFSWRAGFFLNLPIGVLMILLAPRFLVAARAVPGRFDVFGALTSTAGVASLVLGVLHAAEHGWAAPSTLIAIAAGLVLLTVFVLIEARAEQPIMPLRLFRSRERVGGYVARMLYLGAMIGFFFFTTQYLQGVLGFSPLAAGVAFLPMTLVNVVVALAIPAIVRRLGNAPTLIVGVVLTLVGMFWLSRLTPDAGYLLGVALPMVFVGAGQGLAFAPLTTAGIAGVETKDAGAASGVVNTFHQVGSSLGLGVLVAVAAAAAARSPEVDAAAVLTTEVQAALTAGSVLLALALVTSMVLVWPAERRPRHGGVDAPASSRHAERERGGAGQRPRRRLAQALRRS